MDYLIYLAVFAGLFLLINGYFKLADKFNIIDKPNERSSHTEITIRGGGVVFYLASMLFFALYGFQFPYFFLGLSLVAGVSLLDDIYSLSNKLRFGIQLSAVLLLAFQLGVFGEAWWLIPVIVIVAVGVINAYNFMDGINGITGMYSLVLLGSLYLIDWAMVDFIDGDLPLYVGLSLLVFGFYNFRRKAKCFAGDVGSVALAFLVLFLLGKLILQTQNLSYVLLLGLYGADSILTIVHRLIKKENIFEAHRSHLYQYMVHTGKWTHLQVAGFYALMQLLVNAILLGGLENRLDPVIMSLGVLVVLAIFYVVWKRHYVRLEASN